MLFTDLFEETMFSMSANKSRSALTILGIVIGIASVIALISVGQGASKGITDRIQSLGTNLLVISPGSQKQAGNIVRGGSGSSQSLTLEDADAVKINITDITAVAPTVTSRKQITIKGQNTNTSVYGIDTSYFGIKNVEVELGTAITDQQIKSRSKVAVLGPTTRDDLFGEGINPVGQKIRISSQEFSVIGVTVVKGGTGFGSSDDLVYIPLSTAQQYITGNQSVSNISVQVASEDLMSFVQAQIEALLLERHRIVDATQADFSIMNQADMLSTMSSVTDTLTALLAAIAGISLLVGGIGIMNMMLTTVTERTREIGLRKAIGAKRKDINLQFLAEAVLLTFSGGALGIIFGWVVSLLVSRFGGIATSISISSILLAFGVSAAIGIVFGYYPASRAAKLNPIEALRFE